MGWEWDGKGIYGQVGMRGWDSMEVRVEGWNGVSCTFKFYAHASLSFKVMLLRTSFHTPSNIQFSKRAIHAPPSLSYHVKARSPSHLSPVILSIFRNIVVICIRCDISFPT
jgi:hypothetical protein